MDLEYATTLLYTRKRHYTDMINPAQQFPIKKRNIAERDPVSRADHKGDPLGRPNATIVKPSIKLEIKIPPKKARYDKDKEELFYM